ncbi:MAG: arsenosugar biosynthesis radical SAM (seleno)protein ArsS [Thermoplasmatota archaeon]
MDGEDFEKLVSDALGRPLATREVHTFQVNVGLRCNQQCTHCHHRAGPDRDELMSWETMAEVIEKAKEARIPVIDITGGAPELNPHIREFIRELKENGHHIMLRTNLTALLDEGAGDLPGFYRDNGIELIASLPCYEKDEVDCVRGDGVFGKSIEGLKLLNGLGYGTEPELKLNLVFNPMADFLPPPQQALKEEYQHILHRDFGISFTDLFTITNMPMGRFLEDLRRDGKEESYMKLLRSTFNPSTASNLMCLFQINIGWDGRLYDCDFNQALGITTIPGFARTVTELDASSIPRRKIVTGDHCFGCTAGAGSSCGGALVE